MLVAVYRSPKKQDTYLYLAHPADFSVVPEPLRQSFGQPIELMVIKVTAERKLARMSASELLQHLQEQGFYLQLPPPQENLLKTELKP